ncbi:MAG: hypothetical protein VST70_00455 [Nitrospirota bacterium]|nr:hypothetical protein [Nitrospirota bacterium]
MINESIFREYDIRGNAETDLDEKTVTAIGQALAEMLREKGATTLAMGRDVRLTSPRISRTLSDTLLSSGISIIDIGTVPTPLLYYALFTLPVSAGAMITASHNPSPDNGIKLAIGRDTIYGRTILEIKNRAKALLSSPPHLLRSPGSPDRVSPVRRLHSGHSRALRTASTFRKPSPESRRRLRKRHGRPRCP